MKPWITQLTLIALLLFISGCGPRKQTQIRGITDEWATAIVLDHDMKLRDFVTIAPGMDVDRIEFVAPDSGEEIYVCAVGPNVHKDLPTHALVSSKQAEGFKGRVTVNVDSGIITAIMGNGISYFRPVPEDVLRQIEKEKRAENRQRPPSTIIVAKDRFISKLVPDNHGNLIPDNLSEKEHAFLNIVIPAITGKDIQALSDLVHRNADDHYPGNAVREYLEIVLREDIESYQFTRVDPEHPDNKELLEEHNSLPMRWLLTLKYRKPSSITHATLKIGEQDGRLRLPTTYSKSDP